MFWPCKLMVNRTDQCWSETVVNTTIPIRSIASLTDGCDSWALSFTSHFFLGRWLTIGHTRKTIFAQKCDNVFMQLTLFCIKHTFEWSVPRIQHKTDCHSSSCKLLQNDAKDLTIYMYIWSPECTCRSFRRCPSNRYTELAVGISSLEVQLFLFVVPRM